MAVRYRRLLEGIAAGSGDGITQLETLDGEEADKLLGAWNRTEREYNLNQCIHELFEAQARKTPEAVAVSHRGKTLTYGELNERANRTARYIAGRGAGKERIAGICMERSLDMLVGILGVLKAGSAYMPLDPSYPPERTSYMIEDSGVGVILTQEKYLGLLEGYKGETVVIDRDWERIARESGEDLGSSTDSSNRTYVIYTSGSTGKPKGVIAEHRASVNRFNWMWEAYPFKDGEICCQKTSLNFVDSVWEIFGTLLKGVKSVIIPDEDLKDTYRFIDILSEEGISRIVLVPSLMQAMLDTGEDLGKRLEHLKLWRGKRRGPGRGTGGAFQGKHGGQHPVEPVRFIRSIGGCDML